MDFLILFNFILMKVLIQQCIKFLFLLKNPPISFLLNILPLVCFS